MFPLWVYCNCMSLQLRLFRVFSTDRTEKIFCFVLFFNRNSDLWNTLLHYQALHQGMSGSLVVCTGLLIQHDLCTSHCDNAIKPGQTHLEGGTAVLYIISRKHLAQLRNYRITLCITLRFECAPALKTCRKP